MASAIQMLESHVLRGEIPSLRGIIDDAQWPDIPNFPELRFIYVTITPQATGEGVWRMDISDAFGDTISATLRFVRGISRSIPNGVVLVGDDEWRVDIDTVPIEGIRGDGTLTLRYGEGGLAIANGIYSAHKI